jgi:hypothetical protein
LPGKNSPKFDLLKLFYICPQKQEMVKVGDKVRFLNAVGGGKVVRIVNSKIAEVENQDGFEIPTLISELVVIEPSGKSIEKEKKSIPVKKEEPIRTEAPRASIIAGKDSPVFYLALVPQTPENPVNGEIEAWLVNDSNFTGLYYYSVFKGGVYKSKKAGLVGPNSKVALNNFSQNDFSDFPELVFQIIYYRKESKEIFEPLTKRLKINPVKFYKESTFTKITFFEKNAWMLAVSNNLMTTEFDKLTEADIEKVLAAKEKEYNTEPAQSLSRQPLDLVEIDLHITELINSTAGLSNADILEIQLDRFRSEMEGAIRNQAKRIVFIHGVGQGTLKAEVLKELNSKYKKYYVQDASFKEYGYGATMVILRK